MWVPVEAVKVGEIGPVKILKNAKDYGCNETELEKTTESGGN